MMGPRALLLVFAVLLFAFVATAAPIPVTEGALAKKTLKQYKAKRGETAVRGARAAVPSGYVAKRAAAPSQ
ncbi:hypothetical protein B0H19DRAFT_1265885 [Mycena capillaripes]|nr:hypothetical protein B0H19DRAFT_1265885 [Mycena capillaripes]